MASLAPAAGPSLSPRIDHPITKISYPIDSSNRTTRSGTMVLFEHDVTDATIAQGPARAAEDLELRALDVELHHAHGGVAQDLIDCFNLHGHGSIRRASGVRQMRRAVIAGGSVGKHELGVSGLTCQGRIPQRDLAIWQLVATRATFRSSTSKRPGCGSHASTCPCGPAASAARVAM